MKVLLLSADRFELTSENTGEIIEGTTLFYLNKYREDDISSIGLKPTKLSGSKSVFKEIKDSGITLPALASLEVSTKPGAAGKASLVCVGCEVQESVELFYERA